MSKGVQKTLLLVAGIIALSLGLFINKMLSAPVLSTEQLKQQGVYLFEPPRLVKPFELKQHNGQAFTKDSLKGQWSLVFFGFTFCPDVCPMTLSMLNNALAEIKDPAIINSTQVIMVTVDPARDTPEKLAEYVPYFNKDFIGVTGEFLTILSLAGNLNAAFTKVPMDDGEYTMEHSANIFLLNPKGDFQGFFKAPFAAPSFAQKYTQARQNLAN